MHPCSFLNDISSDSRGRSIISSVLKDYYQINKYICAVLNRKKFKREEAISAVTCRFLIDASPFISL